MRRSTYNTQLSLFGTNTGVSNSRSFSSRQHPDTGSTGQLSRHSMNANNLNRSNRDHNSRRTSNRLAMNANSKDVFNALVKMYHLDQGNNHQDTLHVRILQHMLMLILAMQVLTMLPMQVLIQVMLILPVQLTIRSVNIITLKLLARYRGYSLAQLHVAMQCFSSCFVETRILQYQTRAANAMCPVHGRAIGLYAAFTLSFESGGSIASAIASRSSFGMCPVIAIPITPN